MENPNKTPKILYLITKSNWGGAGKYVYDLSNATKEQGYEVVVGLGGFGELKDKLEANNIKVIPIPSLRRDISSISNEFRVFFNILNIIKQEKPDVVHLNSSKIGGLGSLASRIRGVKNIIFTAHGWAFNEKISFLSKLCRKFISWLTIMYSHNVIVLSKKEYSQVRYWPIVKRKLHIIPTGIKPFPLLDKQSARQKLIEIKPELNNHKDETWIGVIAELHKNKNLDLTIDAINIVSNLNVKCIIIGDGEEREKLERKISAYVLRDTVFMLTHITEASHLLSAFDIFLISSEKEGLPYTLLEAGFASLPIIATSVGGIPEIIENRKNGILIESGDKKAIAKAINYIENHPLEKENMSKQIKETITNNFSFEKMKDSTIALYRKNDTIKQ